MRPSHRLCDIDSKCLQIQCPGDVDQDSSLTHMTERYVYYVVSHSRSPILLFSGNSPSGLLGPFCQYRSTVLITGADTPTPADQSCQDLTVADHSPRTSPRRAPLSSVFGPTPDASLDFLALKIRFKDITVAVKEKIMTPIDTIVMKLQLQLNMSGDESTLLLEDMTLEESLPGGLEDFGPSMRYEGVAGTGPCWRGGLQFSPSLLCLQAGGIFHCQQATELSAARTATMRRDQDRASKMKTTFSRIPVSRR